MHLTDARRGGRVVVEALESRTPVGAELAREDLVNAAGRHRGGGFLQPGERGPVGACHLLRKCRLHDRERLAELHGSAFELSENLEELGGGALLQFRGHELGGAAAEPFTEPDRRAPGDPQGQRRELGRAGYGTARDVSHTLHLACSCGGASRRVTQFPLRVALDVVP